MKKTVFIVLVIAAMTLSACAPKATATRALNVQPTQRPAAATQIEVIWYVRSNATEQQWENAVVIPAFEKANPNIKINLVDVPWVDFDTRMQTMIAAGTPPDIWSHWGPSGFQDYVKRGLVADLTPYIEKDKYDLTDFQEEVLNIYKVGGKIMGLPMLTTGSFIFYNKNLFDAAGVAYPTPNWDDTTWTVDKFTEMCKALTRTSTPVNPTKDTWGCNLTFWPNDQFAWMFGKDFYPDSAYQTGFADTAYLGDPLVIKAFQYKQDMVWKLGYQPDPATTSTFAQGVDLFRIQKVAMNLTGGWGWWNYTDIKDFKWGVAALPYGSDTRRDVVFTDPWLLSSKSNHPQEAWTFLKFLAGAEIQESWMKLTGSPPVRKSLAEKWYGLFPGMKPEDVKAVHLGALKYGRESPQHMLVKFDQLNNIVNNALDPINNNAVKAADTLPDANKKLIEALQSIKKEYGQ